MHAHHMCSSSCAPPLRSMLPTSASAHQLPEPDLLPSNLPALPVRFSGTRPARHAPLYLARPAAGSGHSAVVH
eukprot:240401-Chlamydomonas_euryale.AAC.1